MESAIAVAGLTKRYGEMVAVDDVSFTVASGEFFGILGPNGAGKTTTLEMIEGLRQPDSGSISLLGETPTLRRPSLLMRIGVQLQGSAFFERLTTREQLSGGQRQRLSIASALVHDPEIVFLDEPTAALDPQARRNLWDLLQGINDAGRTVVLTTHYMDEAETLCDRVAIMDAGRILEMDSPAALVRGLDAPLRVSVEPHQLSVDQARALPGVDDARLDAGALTMTTREPALVLSRLAAEDRLNGLQVRGASLEDVFLGLTGRQFRA